MENLVLKFYVYSLIFMIYYWFLALYNCEISYNQYCVISLLLKKYVHKRAIKNYFINFGKLNVKFYKGSGQRMGSGKGKKKMFYYFICKNRTYLILDILEKENNKVFLFKALLDKISVKSKVFKIFFKIFF